MSRVKRKKKGSGFPKEKRHDGSDYDDKYQYFHLGHLETHGIGKQVEQALIDNRVDAEKSVTVSGCFTFRWERDAYDIDMLRSIFMVFDYPGMKYLQKFWHPILSKDNGETKKKRRRRKKK